MKRVYMQVQRPLRAQRVLVIDEAELFELQRSEVERDEADAYYAELRARAAMAAEAEQAAADAALVRALLRRRVTQRLSRWGDADRRTWDRHVEIQKSLAALRADYDRNPPSNSCRPRRIRAPVRA